MTDKKKAQAGGDGPEDKKKKKVEVEVIHRPKGKVKDEPPPEPEVAKTPSEIAREEAEQRAMLRKQRFKRKWPEVTKVKIITKPWKPPPPPRKPSPVLIDLPDLKLRKWVPPFMRRRRRRPKLLRIPPEEITQPLYEYATLKKVWHNFGQVSANKMILQGRTACNIKRSALSGAQTACIAVVCRGLLEDKTAAELTRSDVGQLIEAGDNFYKQCIIAMKCYKGKPQIQLSQLLPTFFLHDMRFTIKMEVQDKGVLAKHPDDKRSDPDLMSLMEKRIGKTYMVILSMKDKHFLLWGHPPAPDSGSQVKTVCYIFDPHMLDESGTPNKVYGAGAFLRYAGVSSFVTDFLASYGELDAAARGHLTPITLTSVEVLQKEPLLREPDHDLNLKVAKIHCQSEYDSIFRAAHADKKERPALISLSAMSLASSKALSRRKVLDFYNKTKREQAPKLPVPPEKPPALTPEEIMQMRGEDFFLYAPRPDSHYFGRDDLAPLSKSETVLYSPVDIADKTYKSQYHKVDKSKWILRGTRHMASHRYQTFKTYTGVSCCVSALITLLRLRARAWNEDIVDETLDLGYNFYRESLAERGGPIRRIVLGELKDNFKIRDKEYTYKEIGIAVWGKLLSTDPKVLDVCRGLETFFKERDYGILQIPGELEVAIFNEAGRYYIYHPWPADKHGYRVGLQSGGKACLMYFEDVSELCKHFLDSVKDLKRKPFSITRIVVTETDELPDPVNDLKPIAANRWIVRGRFHNEDERFPEENRGKQAAPMSIAAIAMAHVLDPSEWKSDNIDETLVVGDSLYASTLDLMDKMGIDLNVPKVETEGEEEEQIVPTGILSPTQVVDRFKVTENDFIETEVVDNGYSGQLTPTPGSGVLSLKDSLRKMFKEHTHGVVSARGCSVAVWKQGDSYYYFDPAGCDDKGYSSDEPWASSCLVRVNGNVQELANLVMGNLPPGIDDGFSVNPVMVSVSKMIPAIGAPETKLESKAFQWISKGTAAILMGPRGENTAIGKAAKKAGVEAEDKAGRTLALPAAAAFVAASAAVPPPHMHQDHMFNFIDTGTEYYLNHVKETGNKELGPQDLSEKFEMGVNTFSIELEDPIKLSLRLPDEPKGEGQEEEENEKELGEAEEEEQTEKPMKQIKDALLRTWNDPTKRTSAFLLLGDYHQMGVWMSAGGKVVAFDPAPTLEKGLLTPQRIRKGDELRLQRIKDEMGGEGDDNADEEEEEEEEAMGEGEEKEEVPDFCPPESCPALMVCASPGEFIDKLVAQGHLDRKQCLAPYKLYPVKITNELTTTVKDKKGAGDADEDFGEEEEKAEVSAEALSEDAVGKHFTRIDQYTASVRGRVAQNENCYLQTPNRDHQDVANAVLGIVVDHIEPHVHWKGPLIDAVLQFGDRLYTRTLPYASYPPRLRASELPHEFHLTNFDVNLEVESDVVTGDITAGERGTVLDLARGIAKFFETNTHGIVCAKDYCVGIWKSNEHFCLWEPHSVCPTGVWTPGGAATLVLMSSVKQIAETLKKSLDRLERTGPNKFTISGIKVSWELSKLCEAEKPAAVPDEGYELKVLTAFVEIAKGRTILRGTRPLDLPKFTREACMQSSCGAIVAACMAHVRKPHLWTRHTVDEIMSVACNLFVSSIDSLGYEFRPGDDILVPLQVLKRFVLGVNYIRYDLQHVFSGRLEQKNPSEVNLSYALEQFFKFHTHGILFCAPHAVAVWRVDACPAHYMMEPHACGPSGLRTDAEDDGAACVLSFSSAKQMALAYLQNIPVEKRTKHHFQLYKISVKVHLIQKLDPEPPLVKSPTGVTLVPATSKVYVDGSKRRASERDRKHPPGEESCADTERVMKENDDDPAVEGERNTSGWLVLRDGTQFMSAHHSICCKKFPHASRGKQALCCAIMGVAMSRVEEVCRWCESTLDRILDSGDQLYQDSYLHYRPATRILAVDQVLRKFYVPGNCVCRVVVYKPRQYGNVHENLLEQLSQFFREERAGVLVAGDGTFAVALFRTPRGLYMFDPADRDRVGRALPPPCRGKGRACFSRYPDVEKLAEKLIYNATSGSKEDKEGKVNGNKNIENTENQEPKTEEKEVRFNDNTSFSIYGVDVTALRKANDG
ncbi:uncharacterized protein LOC121726907 [Aricia agestis]|uniref:uncharacterized protein LOC121726907 n=1 Tax=Aricia agestis TaxID=91739 RepID=UPI001C209C13|nr:uncharacterized protein LOC121726907 [Aricia agestis]